VQIETIPAQDLGKGLWRPASKRSWQAKCPETGVDSISPDQMKNWPHGLIDLGNIAREEHTQ
jgi:hypothetical protein